MPLALACGLALAAIETVAHSERAGEGELTAEFEPMAEMSDVMDAEVVELPVVETVGKIVTEVDIAPLIE